MIKTLRNLRRQDKEKFRIPRSVQDAIPVQSLWKNGVFLVGQNRFSKSWQFTDINYGTADDEDKKSMFLGYSELLNSFDSNAYTKISIITRKLNGRDFEKNILIPMKHDEFDRLRKEYNAVLMEKAANGSGMIRDMYITITVVRKNYEEAKNFFTRVGAELNMHLSGWVPAVPNCPPTTACGFCTVFTVTARRRIFISILPKPPEKGTVSKTIFVPTAWS